MLITTEMIRARNDKGIIVAEEHYTHGLLHDPADGTAAV